MKLRDYVRHDAMGYGPWMYTVMSWMGRVKVVIKIPHPGEAKAFQMDGLWNWDMPWYSMNTPKNRYSIWIKKLLTCCNHIPGLFRGILTIRSAMATSAPWATWRPWRRHLWTPPRGRALPGVLSDGDGDGRDGDFEQLGSLALCSNFLSQDSCMDVVLVMSCTCLFCISPLRHSFQRKDPSSRWTWKMQLGVAIQPSGPQKDSQISLQPQLQAPQG